MKTFSVRFSLALAALQAFVFFSYAASADSRKPKVMKFVLVDADRDRDIKVIQRKERIDLKTLPSRNITIRVITDPFKIGSVRFQLDRTKLLTDTEAPYSLSGTLGDFLPFPLTTGRHVLRANPYAWPNKTGKKGREARIEFTIIDSGTGSSTPTPAPSPSATPNPLLDTDGDNLPDAWEVRYFGSLNEASGGDPDSDGDTNRVEYAVGTDPTKPSQDSQILIPSTPDSGVKFSLRLNNSEMVHFLEETEFPDRISTVVTNDPGFGPIFTAFDEKGRIRDMRDTNGQFRMRVNCSVDDRCSINAQLPDGNEIIVPIVTGPGTQIVPDGFNASRTPIPSAFTIGAAASNVLSFDVRYCAKPYDSASVTVSLRPTDMTVSKFHQYTSFGIGKLTGAGHYEAKVPLLDYTATPSIDPATLQKVFDEFGEYCQKYGAETEVGGGALCATLARFDGRMAGLCGGTVMTIDNGCNYKQLGDKYYPITAEEFLKALQDNPNFSYTVDYGITIEGGKKVERGSFVANAENIAKTIAYDAGYDPVIDDFLIAGVSSTRGTVSVAAGQGYVATAELSCAGKGSTTASLSIQGTDGYSDGTTNLGFGPEGYAAIALAVPGAKKRVADTLSCQIFENGAQAGKRTGSLVFQ